MASSEIIQSGRRRGKGIVFVFLAPAILLYLIFFIYPSVSALRISLFDWTGFNFATAEFLGLGNFKELLNDRWVRLAFTNNLYIMVFGGVLMFSSALFFASALSNPRFRGRTFFKIVIFLPYVLNEVGVALLWIFILQPRFGMLNTLLRNIGLESLTQIWLGSRNLGVGSIIFVIVWYTIGFYMVLLMAGIDGIPTDLFDAVTVDGANAFQTFRHLTLPLLRDILSIGVVYWMIFSVKAFGVVWAMTRGAPGKQTHTIATYMVDQALPYQSATFRLGYATSIAVMMCIIVFLFTMVYFRFLQRKEAIEY
jgi:ABC-type sugar transport system permease subunit